MVRIFNTGYPSRGRSFVAGEQSKANFGIRYFRCFSDQIIWEERERTGVERVHFISGLKFEGGKGSWKCRESYFGKTIQYDHIIKNICIRCFRIDIVCHNIN